MIESSRPAPGIALLTLNRHDKRNALNVEVCEELAAIIEALLNDGSSSDPTKAIVITGAGTAFSAGADLSDGDPVAIYESFARVVELIRTAPISVIAHVNGPAIGAGALLSVACDIRVVDPSARFMIPVAKMGVHVDRDFAETLAELVGGARARAMLLAGMPLSAATAVECGFAAVAGDVGTALELAQVCATGDPGTVASIKAAFA
nr:enoyl-CoA hydratase-related protein [Corynebacterium aquatimens]